MSRPLVITGMHRSGTSMVAHAAQSAGVHLGHPDDIVAPAPDNPDGFFEHAGLVAASDTLFQDLAAGWDCPPTLVADDLGRAELVAARESARPVLDELRGHGAWAWKDPRVAPVLPFWLDLVDGLGVVLCLRNPLEVAASLRARNGTSLALGLRLWVQHTIAVATSDAPRIVTHYDAWFHRPADEVARLAEFAGLDVEPERAIAAADVPARHLRHARFDAPSLRAARVHPDVRVLYEQLCVEAGWTDGLAAVAATNGDGRSVAGHGLGTARDGFGQVRPWVVDVGIARHEVHRRNGRVAQLERQLAAVVPPPAQSDAPLDGADAEGLRATVYDLQLQVSELVARVTNGIDAETRTRDIAYARMIRQIRADVRRHVPRRARILVLSEGEQALVDLHGRDTRHFPVGVDPDGPGPHPRLGVDAAAQLIVQQALGATHLVVPVTASWWLAAYPALAARLAEASTALGGSADGSLLLQLHEPRQAAHVADLVAALGAARRRLGREPHVLDATAAGWPATGEFRPPDPWTPANPDLPYLDATIDVVVIDADAPAALVAEAHRVAAGAVLAGGADGWMWAWTGPPPALDVDVVVATAMVPEPGPYLDVVLSTIPPITGVITLVTTSGEVERWRSAARDRAVVTAEPLRTVVTAAGHGSATHLALVDGASVPLDGWLPALLAAFGRGPSVGLVAARRADDGPDDHVVRPLDVVEPGAVMWSRSTLVAHRPGADVDDVAALGRHLAERGLECLLQPDALVADLGIVERSPSHVGAQTRAR